MPLDVWEINPDIRLETQQPIKPDVFYSNAGGRQMCVN